MGRCDARVQKNSRMHGHWERSASVFRNFFPARVKFQEATFCAAPSANVGSDNGAHQTPSASSTRAATGLRLLRQTTTRQGILAELCGNCAGQNSTFMAIRLTHVLQRGADFLTFVCHTLMSQGPPSPRPLCMPPPCTPRAIDTRSAPPGSGGVLLAWARCFTHAVALCCEFVSVIACLLVVSSITRNIFPWVALIQVFEVNFDFCFVESRQ